MVTNLVADREAIIRYLREDVEKIGAESEDVGAVDLLYYLLERYEKMTMMLRMYLEEVNSD